MAAAASKPPYLVSYPLVCTLGWNALERQEFLAGFIIPIDDRVYVVVFPATWNHKWVRRLVLPVVTRVIVKLFLSLLASRLYSLATAKKCSDFFPFEKWKAAQSLAALVRMRWKGLIRA